jgi:sugar/nucleoside kinase (ribokinase family)
LALVDRYPAADERVVGEQISIVGGGPAANAAVVLARQGVSVAFVGRVGAGAEAEHALQTLEDEGVDTSGVLRDPSVRTQASCVVVSKGNQARAISTLAVPPLPELTSTAQELIADAEWVHADHLGYAPTAALLRRLGRRPLFSLDAGNPIVDLDVSQLDLYVPTVQSLTARYDAHATQADEAARKALDEGARAVVATDGAAGSTAWWGAAGAGLAGATEAGRVHVDSTTGVAITSTLGAGDVFHGALVSALCRGLWWPDALRAANATAALSCRALDGRSAVPFLDELDAFLAAGD